MSEEVTYTAPIDRFNNPAPQDRWATDIDFHERLNAIDLRAGIETSHIVMVPVTIVDIEAWPTNIVHMASSRPEQYRQVGARLALHEKLLGLDDDVVNYFHWLGGTQ